jgi:hypothetical protein
MDMTVTVKIHIPDDELGYIDTMNAVPSTARSRGIVKDAVSEYVNSIPMLRDAEATITIK